MRVSPEMRATILFILLVVACTTVPNQPGTVTGVITDPSGALLPGVTVTLHTATGNRTTVTDAQGRYAFKGVAPGNYELQVALPGFNEKRMKLQVAEGKDVRRDANLSQRSVAESITVTAATPGAIV